MTAQCHCKPCNCVPPCNCTPSCGCAPACLRDSSVGAGDCACGCVVPANSAGGGKAQIN